MSGDPGTVDPARGDAADPSAAVALVERDDDAPADSATSRIATTAVRLRRMLPWLLVLLPALVYIFYVNHYAVDVPFSDDWSRMLLVSNAIHGRLTWSQLWMQHSDARIVVPNAIFALSGIIDHLNLRTILLMSAVIYGLTFGLILRLTRAYIGRPITVLPAFALGVVWFSLADWGNTLWSFQIAWFLVLLFLVIAVYFLLVWAGNRSVGYVLAVLAAVAGSLSMLQGFLIWPVGLICIAWRPASVRRRVAELSIWIAVGLVTTGSYLQGYERGVGCFPQTADCSLGYIARRPGLLSSFSLALIGNFIPKLIYMGPHYIGAHQLLGFALLVASAFVIWSSVREWSNKSRPPIALVVVVFALLFELSLAIGRAGEGVPAALTNYRFVMPSTVLVTGIGIYLWAHHPVRVGSTKRLGWHRAVAVLVVLFVTTQAYYNTKYGLDKGRLFHKIQVTEARTVVNLRRISGDRVACLIGTYAWNGVYSGKAAVNQLTAPVHLALANQLSVFAPHPLGKYRALGPPPRALCSARHRAGKRSRPPRRAAHPPNPR